jgi:hypothetical protein
LPALVLLPYPGRGKFVKIIKGERTMKKIVVLVVILLMVFAITIPASAGGYGPAGGIGPGDGTGPIGGLGPVGGLHSGNAAPASSQAQPGSRATYVMVGKIAALGTNAITVDVLRGNKLVQPYLGKQLTVSVTSQTRYLFRDGTTTTTISFANLQVGQPVSINGTLANNTWTASRVTVGASLSCLP